MISMKKTVLVSAMVLGMGIGSAQAAPVAWTGAFDMYNPGGGVVDANDAAPGTSAYVTGMIDTAAGTSAWPRPTPSSRLTGAPPAARCLDREPIA